MAVPAPDHVATITPSGPTLPGQSATLGLTIHNASSVVERYDIRILGVYPAHPFRLKTA